jgi:transposase
MSFEEEEKMMNDLKIKAKDGKIIVAKHIRKIVEAKVGKAVSDDYIWDLFNRHNWKKKMPRPEHPKRNKEAQEEFKKNSQKCWQPNE